MSRLEKDSGNYLLVLGEGEEEGLGTEMEVVCHSPSSTLGVLRGFYFIDPENEARASLNDPWAQGHILVNGGI